MKEEVDNYLKLFFSIEGIRNKSLYLVVIYICGVIIDLITTYLASPELKHESNPVVTLLGFSWTGLLVWNVIIILFASFSFIQGSSYFNKLMSCYSMFSINLILSNLVTVFVFLCIVFFFYNLIYSYLISINNYLIYIYLFKAPSCFLYKYASIYVSLMTYKLYFLLKLIVTLVSLVVSFFYVKNTHFWDTP